MLFISINTVMKLDWTHNQTDGYITCMLDNIIHYKSYDGGTTIKKFAGALHTNSFIGDDWEVEKQWISNHYSDKFGPYTPFSATMIEMEQWHIDHPEYTEAFPAFGLFEGRYLDRLQRDSLVQIGKDMHTVLFDTDEKLHIEWDKNGTGNFYKREWCEENNSFYNVQPCCVFPANPGRTELSEEEKQIMIAENNLNLESL
tara:strand:- start:3153 stop:3752 length:600 start_codon:yes stop_codon:yes gene_type:complete